MALTEATRTVLGNTLTFIETDAEGNGILKDAISQLDIDNLTEVDAEGTGATLVAKMDGYALSNGRDALKTYEGMIVDIDAYAVMVRKNGMSVDSIVLDHEATLADHEARITTLEP